MCFIDHLPGHDIWFEHVEKLYVADWDDIGRVNVTTEEREQIMQPSMKSNKCV
jgi:hypothetical protein